MKTQALRTSRFALIVTTLLLALSPLGLTQDAANTTAISVPHLIKFSGVVKDETGAPKTGVVGVTFAFYKDQQGGAPLWLETQNVQADANGRYTVLLGATKPDGLPMEFFSSNEARWVGAQLQGQNEQPRVLLVSAPYALKAADAETLGGKPISAFQLAAPPSVNSSTQKTALPPEQANEISCAGGAACKTSFIPKFSTNGGSAKVNNSVISQSGTTVGIAGNLSLSGNVNASTGQVLGQTGSFTANTSATVLTVGNQNAAGIAVLGVNENTNGSGVGVQGNGPNGVIGNGTTRGVTGTGLIGVEGDATGTNSIGILGTGSTGVVGNGGSNGTGVKGTGVIALLGEAPSTNSLGLLATGGTGIFGGSQQAGDNFWGMMGTATTSGKNLGVEGFTAAASTAQACMDWLSRPATSEVAAAVARWEYGATPAPTLAARLAWWARPTTRGRSISKTIVQAASPRPTCNRTQAGSSLSSLAAVAPTSAPSMLPGPYPAPTPCL